MREIKEEWQICKCLPNYAQGFNLSSGRFRSVLCSWIVGEIFTAVYMIIRVYAVFNSP